MTAFQWWICFPPNGLTKDSWREDLRTLKRGQFGTERGNIRNSVSAQVLMMPNSVFQLSVLESQSTGEGTPQGVVLALCGSTIEACKEQECTRSLRMYNLASLISLAKWAVVQKVVSILRLYAVFSSSWYNQGARPLDMGQICMKKSSIGKKHKSQTSLAKGLKNLVLDSPIAHPQSPSNSPEPQASYSNIVDIMSWSNRAHPYGSLHSGSSETVDSTWDVIEDLPLRWATHYTPLASTGSRLANTSVLLYDLWQNENQRARGGALLAVATKSNIFLYETPKGERAFRLLKVCSPFSSASAGPN